MPSIRGEWKAWLTFSGLTRLPRSRQWAATSATTSRSPATVTDLGPLTAATPARSSRPRSSGVTSVSDASTAAIDPPGGSSCISRPRAATSVPASARDSTPATWAATTSPTECPSSLSGRSPHAEYRANSAVSSANSAGWANSVVSSSAAPSVPGSAKTTSRNGRRRCGSSRAQAASKAAAYAGNAAYNSRPMPGRCPPCPEKRNACRPGAAARPRTTSGPSAPAASAASAARKPSGSSASRTARCANRLRERISARATAPGSTVPGPTARGSSIP